MTRRIYHSLAVALLALLTTGLAARADEVVSPMGYVARIPDDWTYLSSKELEAETGFRDSVADEASSLIKDKGLQKEVVAQIRSGQMDFILLPTGTTEFRNNINIRLAPEVVLPASRFQALQLRSAFENVLSKMFGTPVRMQKVDLVSVPAGSALYLEYKLKLQGHEHHIVQYMVGQRPGGRAAFCVTGSFRGQPEEAARSVVKSFVESLRIEPAGVGSSIASRTRR